MAPLRIGLDFDNTIITYDEVFCALAKRWGLIGDTFRGRKQALRDAVRLLPDGELAWQRLQGQVYGKGIAQAEIVAGVSEFLRRCRIEGCSVTIVSHKTEFGNHDPERVNLRKAALDWMMAADLFDGHGIAPENVYFESTRNEKLARIAKLGLNYFIDDLEEVLSDPSFPPSVKPILFADGEAPPAARYTSYSTWRDIECHIFGGVGA
jgi:hypothetical protein